MKTDIKFNDYGKFRVIHNKDPYDEGKLSFEKVRNLTDVFIGVSFIFQFPLPREIEGTLSVATAKEMAVLVEPNNSVKRLRS
jgi:hypothetical protein